MGADVCITQKNQWKNIKLPHETEKFWDSNIPLVKDPLPYDSCFTERDNSTGGRAMSFDAGRTAISLISRYNFKCLSDTMELWVKNRYTGNFHSYGELLIEIELSRFAEENRGQITLRSEIFTNVKREVKNRSIIDRNEIAEIKYPEWVNLENYKINIFTGEAIKHDLTRMEFQALHQHLDEEEEAQEWVKYTQSDEKFMFLTKLPIHYNIRKEPPLFDEFLERILPDEKDRLTVYEWIGYCLYNTYDIQKVWLLLGKGANGKSTLLKVIETFLGKENTSCEDIFNLSDNRFASAQLFNKKANIVYEMESAYLEKTSILKSLTGGDTIRGEKKNQSPFSFTNYAKVLLSMNQAFQIKAEALNFAFARRFNVMKFKVQIPENERADQKELIKKLTSQDEISGIFNKAREGLLRLYEAKKFTNSQPESELLSEWTKLSSPVKWFFEEVISLGSDNDLGKEIKHTDLFGVCELIVNKEGLPEVSETAFSRQANKARIPAKRKQVNGVRDKYYQNIHFNNGYSDMLNEVRGVQPQTRTGALDNFIPETDQPQINDILGRIKAYIRGEGGEASYNMIFGQFEEQLSKEEIDKALEELGREGDIWNPRNNWYRIGE